MGWCAVVTAEQLIHELGRETWPRVVGVRLRDGREWKARMAVIFMSQSAPAASVFQVRQFL